MTLNELQILLALNGNERIEYAECEIFASEELYRWYLESICSMYPWYNSYFKDRDDDLLWLAYRYACDVFKGRWSVVEYLIAANPVFACYYAINVIEGRWLEAEAVIARDSYYAEQYNNQFGTKL